MELDNIQEQESFDKEYIIYKGKKRKSKANDSDVSQCCEFEGSEDCVCNLVAF